jgi:hypothetical protein
MGRRHKNTQLRIKNVCKIVQQHYQEGNHAHCYKAIWKRYVYPIYPMSYRTFLSYLNVPPPPDTMQPSLFDSVLESMKPKPD